MKICVICGEQMQRYNPQNALSSIWGDFFQLFWFLKADFQNILASRGIREGMFVWAIGKGEKLLSTQYSVLLFVSAVRSEICKEISISIIYNIIIYIDITYFHPFLMVSHKKVIQLNTEYWVTSNEISKEIKTKAGNL